ncbi:glycosyltransferase [Belnapia moabensis]|uniref:glycosyltransferase n=1 Tax=Belnapia moabensis TaxID=365533 RepID=UPI0005B87FCB|nr:glycosyltransferase [Belnapia moabensis]
MRIVYLVDRFPSLSETFIAHEVIDMIDAGVDVRVFSLGRPKDSFALPERVKALDVVTYFPFPSPSRHQKVRDMAMAALRMVRRGQLTNLRRCLFDKENGGFSRHEMLLLADALSDPHWWPQIIHCHFGTVGRLAAMMKHKGLTQAKITTTLHGYDISKYMRQNPDGIYDLLIRETEHIFTVCEVFLSQIRTLGASKEKTSVLHMGVDYDGLIACATPMRRNASIHWVSVGRMTEKKGHEYAIRGFARALLDNPKLRMTFSIVGDGPLLPKMQALVEELGMKQHITLLGAVQHDEVQALLTQADGFILHSVAAEDGDMEGIPVALMEAMALGLPVVTTRHSGIPELVEHEVTGFLVEERDEAALAKILGDIGTQCPDMSKLVEAARMTIKRDFNRKTQAQRLYGFFKTILGARPGAGRTAQSGRGG